MAKIQPPGWGEPARYFTGNCTSNPGYKFDTVAGRYVVISFFESAARPDSARLLELFQQQRSQFDDTNACFFGVSIDPEDERLARVRAQIPGIRFFWDFDRSISRQYGVCDAADEPYRRFTILMDERLRVVGAWPFSGDAEPHVANILAVLRGLPRIENQPHAPVLVLPRVFEPDLCRTLIEYYDQNGGEESGFMREQSGKTVLVADPIFKRRRDQVLHDQSLRNSCKVRIFHRLLPEVQKAFQFLATRIERYTVARYDAASSGFFHAHRDNTTKGTAHRQFAVSLNLNSGDYEGGFLRFPEFGQRTYMAPTGGAVVFSCSLLHEALPVTAGKRYVFLPFLYDDAAAQVRKENAAFLGDSSVPKPHFGNTQPQTYTEKGNQPHSEPR